MPAIAKSQGRRQFLRYIAVAPLALLAVGARKASAQAVQAGSATCASDDEAMKESLHYLTVSPYGAERNCSNCKLWTAPTAGAPCGGCTLIDGAIDPHGYCDSWALAGGNAAAVNASPSPGG